MQTRENFEEIEMPQNGIEVRGGSLCQTLVSVFSRPDLSSTWQPICRPLELVGSLASD